MQIPILRAGAVSRHTLDTFRGYRAAARIDPGQFRDECNLTADHYPMLAPRTGRSPLAEGTAISGLLDKDALCWVDGPDFVLNGLHIPLDLSEGPKQLVSLGALVVIFPDKMYINTLDLSDFGPLEAHFSGLAQISLCDAEGQPIAATAAPEAPESGLWLDTGSSPAVLRQKDPNTDLWTALAESYIRLETTGIGKDFQRFDGVTVTGLPEASLDGANVVWQREEDFVVLTGLVEATGQARVTLSRAVPEMDFVTAAGNRLWGCRYGLDAAGRPVNEIYASKLGDHRNFTCYMGISTDSYALSLGDDGPFTGAACFRGQPVFFREDRIHRIYGSAPAEFQLLTTEGPGVEKGAHRTLSNLGQSLFYKAPGGVFGYDGGEPVKLSRDLGAVVEGGGSCCAAGFREKYYITMGGFLWVYDLEKRLWHKENDPGFVSLCSCGNTLYGATESTVFDLLGGEETVSWMAQTGPWELEADAQYTSRLTLSMELETGAELRLYARYDGGEWGLLLRRIAPRRQRVSVPVRARRCHSLELRLEGTGAARIFSITRTFERGSEL